jgi:uncharacterized protein YkwD
MISALPRAAAIAVLTLGLAACASGGALSPGLAARMDRPGAQLDRGEALGIVNQYRATAGAPALADDPNLDAQAQALATSYMQTGKQPAKPAGARGVRYSAGYFTFAETFSGWRNSPADAPALSDAGATRAGVAVVYDANSPYGTYWVILLG